MAHGAGGKATQTLIEGLLVPALAGEGETLEEMGDAGIVTIDGLGIAMTTDSYVVRPIRFPGGSIGELAVNGTANDLAVAGARPQALSLSLILEEGLPADELRAEVAAIATAAEAAGRGDRHRRHQGGRARPRRRDVHLHRRDRQARSAGELSPRGATARRPHPRLGDGRRPRLGDHARAGRVLARRGDHSPTPGRSGRRSTRCWTPPEPSCTACATPREAGWPRSSTSWRGRRESRSACARPTSR